MNKLLALLGLFLLASCSKTTPQDALVLKMAAGTDPQTLDPRQARDLVSVNYVHLLFEGLMGQNAQGDVFPALCERFEVYDEGRRYIFFLREAFWSDKTPITADDFVYAWDTITQERVPAPYAHQFKTIKSYQALSSDVLEVELFAPHPTFLRTLSTHPFYAIPEHFETKHPKWFEETESFVCSGPYVLEAKKAKDRCVFTKNPIYWNRGGVELNTLEIYTLDERTALQFYQAGKLDWIGSPIGTLPLEAKASMKEQIRSVECAATRFLRLNVTKGPLQDKELRKALSWAIARHEIVEFVTRGQETPSPLLVPTRFALKTAIETFDVDRGKKYCQTLEPPPSLTLIYPNNELGQKLALVLQQQWKKKLGIEVVLEPLEAKLLFARVKDLDYDLALGSWYADLEDPSDFLNVFRDNTQETNRTGWFNPAYQDVLLASDQELDVMKRWTLLEEAESILLEDQPIIPLFHATYTYLAKPWVRDIGITACGCLNVTDVFSQDP